jgi:hypothetical protein
LNLYFILVNLTFCIFTTKSAEENVRKDFKMTLPATKHMKILFNQLKKQAV